MEVMDRLTTKIGPLPAWAWAGVASGGVIVWRLIRVRSSSAADTATGTGAEAGDAYVDASDAALGDDYGYGGYLPASDIRGPLLGIDQEAADSGVPVELLDRLDALEEATATPAPSFAESLQEWVSIGTLLESTRTLVPAAPNPAPVASVPEPATAPPPVSVGPIAPATPGPKQPTSGEHVWKGATAPNMDTIRQLVTARYGRAVATRTTRPGGGGYLVVVA